MASKEGESLVTLSQEEVSKMLEGCERFMEEIARENKARAEAIKAKKMEEDYNQDYNAEEIKIIANEKMHRRRRERLMRHFRRRQTAKKNSGSSAEESFTSDSDEEMKIFQEKVKRRMEKAIRENMTRDDEVTNTNDGDAATARDEVINTNDGDATATARDEVANTNDGDATAKMEDDSKAEEEEEKMFPRRRGRSMRYLRRQRSKSQDSTFQIEFHHLHKAEESFMSSSSDSPDEQGPPLNNPGGYGFDFVKTKHENL